jgi:hypothetical protein
MIITPKATFIPAPVGEHRGVVVDVTPAKTMQGDWGAREVFRIVYELEAEMEDGRRYMIQSRLYTPSLHEKSALRPDVEKLLGHKLTKDELSSFDTEELLGIPVKLEVEHEETDRGVFARIVYLKRISDKIEPSGDYTRVKDREEDDDEPRERQSEFRRTSGGGGGKPKPTQSPDAVTHPGKIKAHVGRYKGQELSDLSREDIEKLIVGWLERDFGKIQKPSADDKRLASALRQYQKKFAAEDEESGGEEEEEDNVPY